MDAQHSALILMASVIKREGLIDMLKEAISEYEEAILLCKEQKEIDIHYEKFVFHCHLVLLNKVSNNSIEGAVDTMRRMDDIEKAKDFFKPKTN